MAVVEYLAHFSTEQMRLDFHICIFIENIVVERSKSSLCSFLSTPEIQLVGSVYIGSVSAQKRRSRFRNIDFKASGSTAEGSVDNRPAPHCDRNFVYFISPLQSASAI